MTARPLIEAENLNRTFQRGGWLSRRASVVAVRDATFHVAKGETLAIVGESGSGKSTVARMLVGLDRPTGGAIRLEGEDLSTLTARDRRMLGRRIQYVFQDPVASLNPRHRIGEILGGTLMRLAGMSDRAARRARMEELLHHVGLAAETLDRYPHEFSGGQAQRIAIARALAAEARIIVLDEPVSALDVSVQAQVLLLLDRLKAEFDLTYVFISHDLAVVEAISDRVMVMQGGEIVESGPAGSLFAAPQAAYTRSLLASAPRLDRALETL
ncbi:ATP-binding cassette domain-containing protein [Aureimonas altamirensis]|uniref:ATP-binding cassette domain-containing protein n=1 Tax=Aureimonas altamirensis TaxID=370622 RepID=UPI0020376747|nr:ATP-binding cassette domain-containing protein [Aureimonas altamirensis]MCM2504584.1 ATP-binding cassette domain-containing protein [Aureimonas altamirensis]